MLTLLCSYTELWLDTRIRIIFRKLSILPNKMQWFNCRPCNFHHSKNLTSRPLPIPRPKARKQTSHSAHGAAVTQTLQVRIWSSVQASDGLQHVRVSELLPVFSASAYEKQMPISYWTRRRHTSSHTFLFDHFLANCLSMPCHGKQCMHGNVSKLAALLCPCLLGSSTSFRHWNRNRAIMSMIPC